jgi:anti-sigma factor ChrR (cupin superfamily)
MNTHSLSEKAALLALGLLSPEEAAEVETLATQDPALAAEIRDHSETAAQVAFASATEPPAGLRDRVLNKALSGAEHGMVVVRANEVKWRPSGIVGVQLKVLLKDPSSGNWTMLLRMEPGSTYPSHRHSTLEQCLIVEGEVCFDDMTLQAGDFEAAPPGTRHAALSSPKGCVLLLVASPHDELFP